MKDKSEKPITEAAFESAEVLIDLATSDEVLSSIPFVGTAIKLCKAKDSITDKLFLSKMVNFLNTLKDVSPEVKEKIKKKVASSPEEARQIGETLLLAIDRVTDIKKPQIFAFIFIAYLDGVINAVELRRLIQAIDVAFSDDLKKLLFIQRLPKQSSESWMEYLGSSGLTRLVVGKVNNDPETRYYEPTALAGELINAYFHGKKDSV